MFKKIKIAIVAILIISVLNPIKVYATEVENPQNTFYLMTPEEMVMLEKIAVAEAHGENELVMAQIILTVLNRRQSDKFPNTIEGVITEKGQFSTYPKLYNKYEPNETSIRAICLLPFIENNQQLYFENTVPGSWISTNKILVFKLNKLSFYK